MLAKRPCAALTTASLAEQAGVDVEALVREPYARLIEAPVLGVSCPG
jgi:hypothetical protein